MSPFSTVSPQTVGAPNLLEQVNSSHPLRWKATSNVLVRANAGSMSFLAFWSVVVCLTASVVGQATPFSDSTINKTYTNPILSVQGAADPSVFLAFYWAGKRLSLVQMGHPTLRWLVLHDLYTQYQHHDLSKSRFDVSFPASSLTNMTHTV